MIKILFVGFYNVFKYTIYSIKEDDKYFGAFQHSIFVAVFIHVINLFSLVRIITLKIFVKPANLWVILTMISVVGLFIYYKYYKKGWFKFLTEEKRSLQLNIFSSVLSLVYIVISVYMMLYVGDYIRSVLVGDGVSTVR